MTTETLRDVLDWTRNLHNQLADLYQNSAEEIEDERLKLLLSYIAEHEKSLASAISRYEQDNALAPVDNWMQQAAQLNPFFPAIQSMMAMSPFNSETILTSTIQAHQKLVEMYKELSRTTKSEHLKTIFDNLASMELHELMRMVHTSERWNDM